jgi:hypothetical protein
MMARASESSPVLPRAIARSVARSMAIESPFWAQDIPHEPKKSTAANTDTFND